MVEQTYKVVWGQQARTQFKDIYLYIKEDSYDNAEKIRIAISEVTKGLGKNPRRYNSDKLRLDKNPDFRAFEIFKIRISFYINEQSGTVNIIRLRSTRQKPLEH